MHKKQSADVCNFLCIFFNTNYELVRQFYGAVSVCDFFLGGGGADEDSCFYLDIKDKKPQ